MRTWRAWAVAAVAVLAAAVPQLAGVARASAAPSPGPAPHLDAVQSALEVRNPAWRGRAWNRTSGNSLAGDSSLGDWVLQTPDCWGQSRCENPRGFARLLTALHDDLAAARDLVDIVTLDPMPDGMFLETIVAGLRDGYAAGRRPLVRVVSGKPLFLDIFYPSVGRVRDVLAASIGPDARVAVAKFRSGWDSWNHAKIVAVDGRRLVTGGHNLWSSNYLQGDDPVHDLSVHLGGPVAVDAHRFADLEWSFACSHRYDPFLSDFASTRSARRCPSDAGAAVAKEATGSMDVLSVGRLGIGLTYSGMTGKPDPVPPHAAEGRCLPFLWNLFNEGIGYSALQPADVAIRALAASARSSISISQQDVMGYCPATPKYDVRLFDILAEKLLAGVDVRIVTSTPGANWDLVNQYSNVESLQATSRALLQRMRHKTGSEATARVALCTHLQLAHVRPGPFDHWANGHLFANHAKLLAVDDAAFFVGSENLYPSSVQEWGVMVEDAAAADTLQSHYLGPLWDWSRATAVVDAGQGRCEL